MDQLTSLNKLDIFTKIDPSFTRTSSAGGTVSLLTYILIVLLLFGEIANYLNPEIEYHYSVDTEFDKLLDINVDITVATPCSNIGADVMDATNKQSLYTYGRLEETEVNFGLNEEQQRRWDRLRSYNAFLRAEHHNVHTMLWKPGYLQTVYGAVEGQKGPHHHHHDLTSVHLFPDMDSNGGGGGSDSCRFSGTISVNKVAGNLHISAGKYLPLPIGHAHVSLLGGGAVNYSHRIERLSFGDDLQLLRLSPLDGVEKVTSSPNALYQYYLKVVRTEVHTAAHHPPGARLYQYSVTERSLVVDHDAGAHGVPGIYLKYEIDGLKVEVREEGGEAATFWQFAVRLCAILGGVLAISGLLNQIATAVGDVVTGRYIGQINFVD